MKKDDLAPPLPDAPLSDEVRTVREAAAILHGQSAHLEAALRRRIAGYRTSLDECAEFFRVPLDTSTLDLGADTRWTALWQLGARALNLGHCLLVQVEGGFGPETYPTARAINETNRLLQVFCDPEEDGLLMEWLGGRSIKAATLRKAVARVHARQEARRVANGAPALPPAGSTEADLYRALSESVHPVRASTRSGVSLSARTILIGEDPNWATRASNVSWAGSVIWEVMHCTTAALSSAGGARFYTNIAKPLMDRFEAIDTAHRVRVPEASTLALELTPEDAARIIRDARRAERHRPTRSRAAPARKRSQQRTARKRNRG